MVELIHVNVRLPDRQTLCQPVPTQYASAQHSHSSLARNENKYSQLYNSQQTGTNNVRKLVAREQEVTEQGTQRLVTAVVIVRCWILSLHTPHTKTPPA